MAQVLPFERNPAVSAGAHSTDAPHDHAAGGEWAQWMRLAQGGDRAAYQRVLQAIVPYLTAIARRHLGNADAAEDAVQEILMIVHGVRHTYEPDRPLKPWLATIARRHCIDIERRRLRRLRHETADDTAAQDHPDPAPTPEETLAQHQQATAVRDAVAALPPGQRAAVGLMKLDELSLREASASSGLSIPALKVACHRAIRSLGRRLGDSSDG